MKRIKQSLVLQFLIFTFVLMVSVGVGVGTILSLRIDHTSGLLIEHEKAMKSGVVISPDAEFSTSRLINEVGHLGAVTYSLLAGSFSVLFIGVVGFVWRGSTNIIRQRDEQSRLAKESAIIAEVGRIISSSLEITHVYEGFAREFRKLIPFDRIVVGLVDLEKDTFTPAHIIGTPVEGRGVGDIIPLFGSATEEVVRKKAPLLMKGESDEWLQDRFPATEPGYRAGLRSIIAVPLISKDQVIGFLRLQSTERSDYTERDLALLERVGSQIAGAIANSQLYEARKRAEEQEHRAAEENRALAEIGRVIGSSLDINEVYDRLGQEVRRLMPFDRMSLSLIDKEGASSSPAYVIGEDISDRFTEVIPFPKTVAGQVFSIKSTIMLEAENEEDLRDRFPGLLPAFCGGLRSFMAVPLINRDAVTGVLQIQSKERNIYTQGHLDLAERICNQIAGAIASSHLYEALQASVEEMALVDEISRMITSTLDIDQVYDQFAAALKKLVHFDRVGINVIDIDAGTYNLSYVYGSDIPGRITGDTRPLEGTLCQHLAITQQTLNRPDLSQGPTFGLPGQYPLGLGFKSGISVPLVSKGKTVGLLSLLSNQLGMYGEREQVILERISSQIAPAIENSTLFEESRRAQEEQQRLAVENAVLAEIGRIISSSLDIDEVYEHFADVVGNLLKFDRIGIALVDLEQVTFTAAYNAGADMPHISTGVKLPLAGTQVEEVVRTKTANLYQTEDIQEFESRFPGAREVFEAGFRSFLTVPLFSKGEVSAVLRLRSFEPNAYTQRDVGLLARIGNQIAPAVENSQLYQQLQTNIRETSVIAEIGRVISSSLDINEVYDRLSEEVRKLVPFDRINVSIIDTARGVAKPAYIAGTDVVGRRPGDSVEYAGTLTEEVARTLSPMMLDAHTALDLRDRLPGLLPAFNAGLRSFLAVPLIDRKNVLGVFHIRSKHNNIYSQEHLDITTRIGNQIAGAIANSQLYEALQTSIEEMAVVDEVAQIVTSTLVIDDVYDVFASEVKRLVAFDRMAINIIDPGGQTFTTKHTYGEDFPGRLKGSVSPLKGSRDEIVASQGKTLIHGDIGSDLGWPMDQASLRVGLRSVILVPLTSNARVIGTFGLRSREENLYGNREKIILERLANQIAPAIENATLYQNTRNAQEEQRRLAEENLTLAEIGRIVGSSLHIDEVYAQFSQEVSKLIPFDNINIATVNHEQGSFTNRFHDGIVVSGREIGQIVPLAGSATERVVQACKGYLLHSEDRAEIGRCDPGRLPNFDAGLRSFISVPLMFRDTVTGVLHLRSSKPNAYTDRDLALAERIGLQIAPALENARLYEETRNAEESERQRSEELGALLEVASILNQSASFESKVSKVMAVLARICDADSAAFRVPEEAGLRRIGYAGEPRGNEVVSYDGNIPTHVYEKKEIIVANDYASHPLAVGEGVQWGLKSLFASPIVSGESVIGIVIVNSTYPNHFTPELVSLVLGIINGLGSLLENARLEDERAQAEQELRESERRFRQISENMREIVFLLDHQNYQVLYVNEAFEEIWGRSCKSLYENPEVWIGAVHPDDLTSVEAAVDTQHATGEFEAEFRIIRPDGTIRWIYNRGFPILNESGEVYRLVGIAEDITQRVETQERLQETARLASIGELAAGVAHEINNPLTSVLGYSELVLSKSLPAEAAGDIQTIYDEAQRAARIVQNLLFFARRRNTEKEYLDLNSVLIRSLEMKSYDFKVSNIDVVTDLPQGVPKTMIDEHQMVQVFLNILGNAEQAIHQSSGRGQIGVRTVSSDDGIEIIIDDDGPGIPSEVLNRIFEPFFTTKEVGKGTGLGLSISYGIIKQHGGDIWAESVEGGGTTFHITLPVAAPEELKIFETFAPPSSERTTKHLLVVDDEPHIRNLLGKHLESERYTVDLAEDGYEAWRKLVSIDYDCILLDVKMPGLSGPELYQLIQTISESLASKIVFVTGDTVSPGTRDFISETGNPVVAKPFRMSELLRAIHELWDRMPAGV